ncbi:hypothetical protein CK203_007022 [Vitis vinifera]|uniref:Uncharacterized protein n=1 Tax=Vitis vinifera TaxID=29760 RepID=A0A438KCV9_VITVI|nr:hypothetical protein CK203_007022 [Vitis vinifera]
MDQGQALVGLPRTSQGFSSDSRKLPSKLNREVSGKARSQGSNGRGSGVDNALLAKAAAFEGRSDSRLWGGTSSFSSPSASVAGSPGDCRALIQPLGDNCDQEKNSQPKVGLCEGSFKCPKNIMESPLGKDLVVSLVGMSIERYEKEIFSLLRKIETRKGCGVCVLRKKKKLNSTSRFEREIQKLECSVNYKNSPLLVKGKGGVARSQTLFFFFDK